jgi:hypothetical protein
VSFATSGAAIAIFAAMFICGCGGRTEEQAFTPADAKRIANVRPETPGWTWPQHPEKRPSAGSPEGPPTDRLDVRLKRQTAAIVPRGDAGNKWEDANKLANLSVQVLPTSAKAHELMAPFNAYSRGWGKRFGRIAKDEEFDGLGDEAWLLRTESNGTEVTYHWRRGNLVIEAHVHCFGSCPGDVGGVTRAWVDAIDEVAASRCSCIAEPECSTPSASVGECPPTAALYDLSGTDKGGRTGEA